MSVEYVVCVRPIRYSKDRAGGGGGGGGGHIADRCTVFHQHF